VQCLNCMEVEEEVVTGVVCDAVHLNQA